MAQFFATERGRNQLETGVYLSERAFLGHINLRGDPASWPPFTASEWERVTGLRLPLKPNTVAMTRELTALWLGPDEWLILTPLGRVPKLVEALQETLGDEVVSLTDVSSGQTVIVVYGPCARDVLAKGCSLDLHPRVFGLGRCAQTRIAKAAGVIIRAVDPSPSFDLIVRRSYGEYLALWLEDAAREYGVTIVAQPVDLPVAFVETA